MNESANKSIKSAQMKQNDLNRFIINRITLNLLTGAALTSCINDYVSG